MAKHNVWMSVSDLMTGLMIIFLFIAVAYIKRVQENQTVLREFVETKSKLHDKLINQFSDEIDQRILTFDGDLTMRFNNAKVNFASGSYDLTPEFASILDEVIPRYFDIMLHDNKFVDKISEIRIEGHTDDEHAPRFGTDPFLSNVHLSQMRTLEVMQYIWTHIVPRYEKQDRQRLQYWLTANGMSYSRSLDDEGNLSYLSGHQINRDMSRRVEFRIITRSDKLLEEFVKGK